MIEREYVRINRLNKRLDDNTYPRMYKRNGHTIKIEEKSVNGKNFKNTSVRIYANNEITEKERKKPMNNQITTEKKEKEKKRAAPASVAIKRRFFFFLTLKDFTRRGDRKKNFLFQNVLSSWEIDRH